MPPLVAASISVFALEVLEGFNHADGLMDSADAWMARGSKERKLEVMKDKYTGAAAVATFVMTSLVTVASLAYLPYPLSALGLAYASSTGSLGMSVAAELGRRSGGGGLGDQFLTAVKTGNGPKRWLLLALAICMAAIPASPLMMAAPRSVAAFLASIAISACVGACEDRSFGFTNGDVLGANYELDRMLSLVLLVIVLRSRPEPYPICKRKSRTLEEPVRLTTRLHG